jgi:hypothetical protein
MAFCSYRSGWVLCGLFLAAFGVGGCSTAPFDATAPWVPLAPARGQSFAGGFTPNAPESGFARFESRGVPADDVVLPGESGENPWATRPRNVVVQVCYGAAFNSSAEVKARARKLCPTKARLRYLGQDAVFNDCPLIQPARAVYRCVSPAGDGDGEPDGEPNG